MYWKFSHASFVENVKQRGNKCKHQDSPCNENIAINILLDICEKTFQNKGDINKHVKILHAMQILPCKFCEKTFKNKLNNFVIYFCLHEYFFTM